MQPRSCIMWTALYNRAQYGLSEKVRTHICRLGLRGGELRQVGSHVGAHVQRQHGLLLQVLLQRCAVSLQQTKVFRLQDELLHLSTSPGQALQKLSQGLDFNQSACAAIAMWGAMFSISMRCCCRCCCSAALCPCTHVALRVSGEAPAFRKADLGKLISTFSTHRNVDPFRSNTCV